MARAYGARRRQWKDDEWGAEDWQLLQELPTTRGRRSRILLIWTRAIRTPRRRDHTLDARSGEGIGATAPAMVMRASGTAPCATWRGSYCATLQELDGRGWNVRRLIIGGGQYVEPPEDEEWDIHFLISRCGATNQCSANTAACQRRTPVEAEL